MEFDNRTSVNIIANGVLPAPGGSGIDVQDICDGLGVTVEGTFDSASVQVEISMNGDAFIPFGAPFTAAGFLALPPCAKVQFRTLLIVTAADLNVVLGGIRSTQRHD